MSAPKEEPKTEEKKPAKKGGGAMGIVLGVVLPSLLAAGAAFGGVKFANKGAGAGHAEEHAAPAATPHRELKPPGPTMALEPFLVSMQDAAKKGHPVKLTIAIEFESTAKEDQIKTFQPRIRDAVLQYMRKCAYEDVTDSKNSEKFREDLLEKVQKSGAYNADRILVTDLVSQ